MSQFETGKECYWEGPCDWEGLEADLRVYSWKCLWQGQLLEGF